MGRQISAKANLTIPGYAAIGNSNKINFRDSKDHILDIALGNMVLDEGLMVHRCVSN